MAAHNASVAQSSVNERRLRPVYGKYFLKLMAKRLWTKFCLKFTIIVVALPLPIPKVLKQAVGRGVSLVKALWYRQGILKGVVSLYG